MPRTLKRPKATVKRHASGATAVQVDTRDGSVVALGDLRVLITKSDGAWIAQGLEIDYAAEGDSLVAAKTAFERGLSMTVAAHLRVYGSIQNLLNSAPKEMWDEFLASHNTLRRFTHSQVTVRRPQQHLPFGDIVFYERVAS